VVFTILDDALLYHPDGDGGGDTSEHANPGGTSGDTESKPKTPDPKLVSMSQEDLDALIDERLTRARSSWDRAQEVKRNEEQGEFKTIVEEEYKPLLTKVKDELEPELDHWRKLARQEVAALKKDVPEEILDLMPERQPLFDQLDWLRRAKERAAKLTGGNGHDGNNPLDDPRRKKEESRDEVKQKLREQFMVSTRYST
jgi:hypothetical protein